MPWLLGGVYLACIVAAVALPVELAALLGKEGPVEQLSHALLLVAAAGWARAAARRGERPAWPFIAATALCLVLLVEELDWGGVYGLTALADPLREAVGHPNLHNAIAGGSYILFGLPVAAVYGPALAGRPGPLAIRHDHAIAVVLVVIAAIASTAAGPWEPAFDELSECLLYAVLVASAWASGLSVSK